MEAQSDGYTPTSAHGAACPECRHGRLAALRNDEGVVCDNCDRWWASRPLAEFGGAAAQEARAMNEYETLWLYYGERVLTSVRVEVGTSAAEAQRLAIENYERLYIGHEPGEAPFEFLAMLRRAEVRR